MEAEIGSGAAFALGLGFLLGLRHATDADHVVAVSTIVSEYRNAFRGLWVGGSWGLGHTTPLLILGTIILLLKETVLDRYEVVAPYFEFGVAIMLVYLGVQVFWTLRKKSIHVHAHSDPGDSGHVHVHASHEPETQDDTESDHGFFRPGKPIFRTKSFVIGVIHGLAGSAAVMLLLLPQVSSFLVGILFILMFGLGTVISLAIITVVLGIPFAVTGRFERLNAIVARVAGSASVLFGFALMSDIALGTAIIPF